MKRKIDSEELKNQWLLQNEKICICKGIPRKSFMAAIKKGASTLQEVNRIAGDNGYDSLVDAFTHTSGH